MVSANEMGQLLINAVTGNVEASTYVTGKLTKRALGLLWYLIADC